MYMLISLGSDPAFSYPNFPHKKAKRMRRRKLSQKEHRPSRGSEVDLCDGSTLMAFKMPKGDAFLTASDFATTIGSDGFASSTPASHRAASGSLIASMPIQDRIRVKVKPGGGMPLNIDLPPIISRRINVHH